LVISNGQGGFNWTGTAEETAEEQWVKPFRTRSSWLAFTNSMSDPFHKDLSDAAVLHFFRTLHLASWHTWQVLTKRHKRMARFMARLSLRDGMLQLSPRELPWDERAELPNVWIGVTAENQKRADERLRYLREVKAAVRFVSMEPLLGHVTLGPLIADIDWVIVGGESAAAGKYRPMENAWARALRDECRAAGVPFYFKQRSGERPWLLPKDLDGEFLKQLPLRQKLSAPSPEARRQLIAWARAEYAVVFP
jgi:protein gp37